MERRAFVKCLGATTIYIGASSCGAINIFGARYNEEVCKSAWENLRELKSQAFKYVTPQKKLPNVLIYGDSISIGYTPIVREMLSGKVNVFRIYTNGQSSDKFIPFMEKMKETMFQPYLKGGWNFDWDLIHFNVGLHDLKYLADGKLDKETGKQMNNIEEYKTNLNKICMYLKKEFPNTKLIFATTTAVPDEGDAGRFGGDSIKYNNAAKAVLANYPSIVINDLYGFTKPNSSKWYIKPRNVHYNNLGKTTQGKHVAKVITENL
ncbi:SGNH/GDSL hydrolase family protein [Lutibacter sp. A80]|uniref:SGNH/GDSL hydrolase family protein n=1 Tax=Lutibacter sp. A80 TaxID=2918453 RepID=UPI001F0702DD|nr:SGNH/GDSL hydrolase family protein [Lutibacter sp. A80]UMB61779.1 SGNH/GDSL hydrolase family protein [Lutibacter sp. A80]